MNRRERARAKKILGTEDGPVLVGLLCAHDERLKGPEHRDRLVALATYLRPNMTGADELRILKKLQASPTRAEFETLLEQSLDNLCAQALEDGLIREDDGPLEQMLHLSSLVLTMLAKPAETPLGEHDLRRNQMIALLSGVELREDEHEDPNRVMH
jgi:hypothetical protein